MYNQRQQLKTYDIHPVSIKLIRNGHPWITLDKFSEKFHPKEKFIIAANRKKPFALLIHDPTHKDIKARVWATQGKFQQMMKNFKNDLSSRLRKAFKNRKDKKYLDKRNHFYLTFGENDEIPGLFIRYFNEEILIEFYMEFWKPYQDFIVQNVIRLMSEVFDKDLSLSNIWVQYRSENKQAAKCLDPNTTFKRVDIEEFGIKYKVYLGKHYDTGIYTDMAAIREKLRNQFKNAKSLLNLYSYTGAFSLYGLGLGMNQVTSVDLSENYLEWLQENLELNGNLKKENHTSLAMSTKDALLKLLEEKKKFELIISDPPSSSSDGNRVTNALGDYQETLPMMCELLDENGQILVFLNTHRISMDKFKSKIKNIIHKNRLPLFMGQNLYLSDDCPYRKGFPEGSYLKGIILKYKSEKPKTDKPQTEESKSEMLVDMPVEDRTLEIPEVQTTQIEVQSGELVESKAAKKVANAKKVTKKVTKKATKKVAKKIAKKVTKKAAQSKVQKKTKTIPKKKTADAPKKVKPNDKG